MVRKIVMSHPTGNAFVRAAAGSFLQSGSLQRFYTSVATFPGTSIYQLSRWKRLQDIRRRSFEKDLQPFTKTYPFYEAGRILSSKLGLSSLQRHETGIFSIDNVYRKLDHYVAEELASLAPAGADAVYCYEDGALQTFQSAKELGMYCVYDLPIGYWRVMHQLLEQEKINHPDWANTITGFSDSVSKLKRKDEELALADHVIVASNFTARTLQSYPGKIASISVVPYGFPEVADGRLYTAANQRPLKLLFVGSLSQRKGIANLFEAIAPFNRHIELTLIGNKVVKNCPPLDAALAKHHWTPSLPQETILKIMQQHDLLVFPSLFEGFGLVITEAMSQGMPVITTERTAGPDMIQHGENGWIVPAGNTDALQEILEQILQTPAKLQKAGRAAMETARKRPWQVYGQELIQALNDRT